MKNKQLKQIIEDYNLNITCKAQKWVILTIIDGKRRLIAFDSKHLKNTVYLFLAVYGEDLQKYTWLRDETISIWRQVYYVKQLELEKDYQNKPYVASDWEGLWTDKGHNNDR